MKSSLMLVAICGCLLASGQASDTRKPAPKQQPTAFQTLDQMPAVPPQVSFQNGQLTITAQNCTLGDVLKAVHTQTGAQVELPGSAGERVVGNFGPGPARDVLSALLNGSHFNYVLLGSETDPQALDRVILTAKSASPAGSGQQASTDSYQGNNNYVPPQPLNPNMMMRPLPGRPGMAPMPNPNQQGAQAEESTDDQADADATDDATDADQTDDADQTTDDQADETVQGEEPANQGVKTPEQLLQELQQQQQQQQGNQQTGTQPGLPPNLPPGVIQPPH